jgi:hypothetical protein
MVRRDDLRACWPGELKLRTDGSPQGGLVPYVTTVKTKSGASRHPPPKTWVLEASNSM